MGGSPIKFSFILLFLFLFFIFFYFFYLNNLVFDAGLFCRNKELKREVTKREAAENKTREVPFLSSIFLTFELQ